MSLRVDQDHARFKHIIRGRIRQNLPYAGGDVREPAWGPFID